MQQEVEEQLKKAIGAFEITAGHAQQEGIGERFDAAMDPEEETDAFLIDSVRYCTEVLGLDKDALLRELAKLEDPGVKAFFIVNPSNPASHALSEKTLRRLVQVVEKNPGLIILTDDVYGTFVQDFQTVYSVLPYNTILVYSFSKLYGVTGWRVGLIAMNRDNVCDRLLDELPQEDKDFLHDEYAIVTSEPEELPFLDRVVADSRSIGLYHTSGLSTPSQVFMALMSMSHLVHEGEEDPYTRLANDEGTFSKVYTEIRFWWSVMEIAERLVKEDDQTSQFNSECCCLY